MTEIIISAIVATIIVLCGLAMIIYIAIDMYKTGGFKLLIGGMGLLLFLMSIVILLWINN